MLKIVYFDEGSAIDYLDVFNGGKKAFEIEKESGTKAGAKADTKIRAGTGVLFKALKPFLDLKVEGGAGANIDKFGASAVRTTISNCVLTDYINAAENDTNIEKIVAVKIKAYKNSISYMKMYTPYLNMIKMENAPINFSQLDEILEKSKGYYELISEYNSNEIVLRFNIRAFRNNYCLVDLTKMKLKLYAIEVGEIDRSFLRVENELDFDGNKKVLTGDELMENSEVSESTDLRLLYDVILAGVTANG